MNPQVETTPCFSEVKLSDGTLVTVEISRGTRCKKCRAPIMWGVSKDLKNIPIAIATDGSMVNHVPLCKGIARARERFMAGSGDLLSEVERQKERDRW